MPGHRGGGLRPEGPDVALPGHRRGPMGPYGPNVATELEAALVADLSGGLGEGGGGAEPPAGLQASGTLGLGPWGPMGG